MDEDELHIQMSELDGRISTLEQNVGGYESDGLRSDIQLTGEALGIIRRVLVDLVEATGVDASEYADDLDRLEAIERMLTFSS